MYSRVCRGTREVLPAGRQHDQSQALDDCQITPTTAGTKPHAPEAFSHCPSHLRPRLRLRLRHVPHRVRAHSPPDGPRRWRLGTQQIFKLVTTHTHFALLIKKATGPATTISIIHCFWLPVTTVAWPRRTILLLGNWCLVGSSSVMAMGRRCRFYGEHTLILRTRLLCFFWLVRRARDV
jgi:hypothetical protein